MKFNNEKRNPNSVVRIKLYKKGKTWVTKTMLAMGVGLTIVGSCPINVLAATTVDTTKQEQVSDLSDKKTLLNQLGLAEPVQQIRDGGFYDNPNDEMNDSEQNDIPSDLVPDGTVPEKTFDEEKKTVSLPGYWNDEVAGYFTSKEMNEDDIAQLEKGNGVTLGFKPLAIGYPDGSWVVLDIGTEMVQLKDGQIKAAYKGPSEIKAIPLKAGILVHYLAEDTGKELAKSVQGFYSFDHTYIAPFKDVNKGFLDGYVDAVEVEDGEWTKFNRLTLDLDMKNLTKEELNQSVKVIKDKPLTYKENVYFNEKLYSSEEHSIGTLHQFKYHAKEFTSPKRPKNAKRDFSKNHLLWTKFGKVKEDVGADVINSNLGKDIDLNGVFNLTMNSQFEDGEEVDEVAPNFYGSKYELSSYYYTSDEEIEGYVIIPTNLGDKVVDDVKGKVGDKVPVKVPDVQGYTPDKKEVMVTIDENGKFKTKDTVKYTGNEITSNVTINTNKGDKTVENVKGRVGEKITVKVPPIKGFTPNKTEVTAVINPDGTITTDETVTYTEESTQKEVTADVTIKTNQGDKVVKNVKGKVGDKIPVEVPKVDGYTPDKKTVIATVNEDGTITTNEEVNYQKDVAKEVTADVTIKTNQGDKIVKNVKGKVGDKVPVEVPKVDGYTPDKTTVTATVNENGTITTTESVVYKKDNVPGNNNENNNNQNNNSAGNNGNNTPQAIDSKRLVATFSDRPEVTLYNLDNVKDIKKVGNRALAKDTGWASDKEIKIGKETYYRVATHEWVKSSDVYVYEAINQVVTTKSGSYKRLNDAHHKEITNRALEHDTSWKSDRKAYIDGHVHYRVATNEFIHPEDVK